jgi:gamma-glutamyltranspeptidase/glutathione hydrolase
MSTIRRGLIAAGHPDTAQAGISMLEAGGNAFDAALAAMLASFVAEASLTSMGGGGFMTAYTAEGKSRVYDFFVQTPRERKPRNEMDFRDSYINFGTTQQHQYIGKGSVATPGCPAGLFHIHQQLGRLPMSEIIQPAVKLAREGVLITPYQAYSLFILESILTHKPELARLYAREGRTLKAGERMYLPAFANTLEWLCAEGVEVFYQGEIAEKFAKDNAENGGSISLEDLKSYRVIEREPHKGRYRHHLMLTNPPPSAGGSLICYGLEQAEKRKIAALKPHGSEYLHQLTKVIQAMDAYRRDHLTGMIDQHGSTTHISVMDTEGNAASLTTTLGGASGELIPGTDIQTNNMLGELDLFPQGVYQWPENRRVSSMMSPSIVLHNKRPRIVIGTGGSSRIRTAILQVVINLIGHEMGPHEAVQYPRIHWENHHFYAEPGLLDPEDMFSMPGSLVTFWEELNMYFGGTHTLIRDEDGSLHGAADARRAGVVMRC